MSDGRQAREWPRVMFPLQRFAVGFAERADDAWRTAEDRRFYNGAPEEERCEECGAPGRFVCDCYAPALSVSGDFRDTCDAVLCSRCAVWLVPHVTYVAFGEERVADVDLSGWHACPRHAAWANESEGARREANYRERWAKKRWARPKRWVTDGQRWLRLVVGGRPKKRRPAPMAEVIPLRTGAK